MTQVLTMAHLLQAVSPANIIASPYPFRCPWTSERERFLKRTVFLKFLYPVPQEARGVSPWRDDVAPGMVMNPAPARRGWVHIQTYGRWANWNPHLHGIASDGCFDSEGNFYPLPKISNLTLEKIFVHTKVRIDRDDKEGLQGLAQYIIRCPIAEDKILFSPDGHTVIYKSAIKPGIEKNFEVYNVLEFLAAFNLS